MNVETFLHHAASSENYCFRLLAASLCLYSSFAVAQSCGTPEAGGIARTLNDAVLSVSPVLNVDADGAPNWYLVIWWSREAARVFAVGGTMCSHIRELF